MQEPTSMWNPLLFYQSLFLEIKVREGLLYALHDGKTLLNRWAMMPA